ncbi:DUF3616 domain-containing protein [Mesorhizobium qingshengii]|uniref:DUF3616 domain-containing protein n=1 Tax=Mesorhizobium qingshengii TaxID=1165689 RepID=A0ABT4QZ46_9HYPH|nr:DUF3616 domain-containing protein [Mesorhizobium qingshengii]MCZ8546840.1 DUF3616 domain-containing protein [Mesorhizobium qingshengii]
MAQLELRLDRMRDIVFDYANAQNIDAVISNVSGIAIDGKFAWTVSDEGRTFECLSITEAGFVLDAQYNLDDFFTELPEGHEADLESVDVANGRLWLCGSHCRVRREPKAPGILDAGFRRRPSRHLLGSIELNGHGRLKPGTAKALPYTGDGSLRRRLRSNPFLSAFLNLPSKENGLDIEGLTVLPKQVLLGLRGPVIDSHAVVVALPRKDAAVDGDPHLHVLDFKGLGVRDLARDGDTMLVLAGPVTAADGPFRIYRWRPSTSGKVETADVLHEWAISHEHPESLCPFTRNGEPGVLVVYDTPDQHRRSGTQVTGDWFALS